MQCTEIRVKGLLSCDATVDADEFLKELLEKYNFNDSYGSYAELAKHSLEGEDGKEIYGLWRVVKEYNGELYDESFQSELIAKLTGTSPVYKYILIADDDEEIRFYKAVCTIRKYLKSHRN